MKKVVTSAMIIAGAFSLAACEPVQTLEQYRPVVDTAKVRPAKFEKDLAECKIIAQRLEADYKAKQEKEMQQNLVAGLIAGALVGAVAGTNSSYQGDYIAAGAVYGAAAGAASGDYTHDLVTYGPRRVVDRCMSGRGYNILNDIGRG